MNLAEFFYSEEKPTASSLGWWIKHPAKPLPNAKSVKGIPSIGSWRRPAGWKKKK
jgi:hypothetical protein